MRKIKVLGVFICVLCLIVLAQTLGILKHPTYSATCLELKHDDSETFGRALAVNDNYLAVGDPNANRVVIYQRQADDNWLRVREITPPKGTNAKRIGNGFGTELALEKEALVILSTNNQRYFSEYKGKNTEELFVTPIDQDRVIQKINYFNQNSTPISALSFFNGNIAFADRTEISSNQWKNRIYIAEVKSGQILKVIEPPELQEINSKFNFFDISLDNYKNSLVIINNRANFEKFSYLLSPNNRLTKILLDLRKFSTNKFSSCIPTSTSISNEVMITNCVTSDNSFVFQNFPQPSLVAKYPLFGIVDAKQPYVLISYRDKPSHGPSYQNQPHHVLMKIQNNKISQEFYIRWSYNKKTNRSITRSLGVISKNNLFLSAEDGRVVYLPMKNLPSSYRIEQNICGE